MLKINYVDCDVNYVLSQGNFTYGHSGGHCALYKNHNGSYLDVGVSPDVRTLSIFNKKIGYDYFVEDEAFEEKLQKEIQTREKGYVWDFPDFTTEELQLLYNPLPNKITLELFEKYTDKEHKIYKIPWAVTNALYLDKEDSFIGGKDFCYIFSSDYYRYNEYHKYII